MVLHGLASYSHLYSQKLYTPIFPSLVIIKSAKRAELLYCCSIRVQSNTAKYFHIYMALKDELHSCYKNKFNDFV